MQHATRIRTKVRQLALFLVEMRIKLKDKSFGMKSLFEPKYVDDCISIIEKIGGKGPNGYRAPHTILRLAT